MQPIQINKINYKLTGCTIQVLGLDDILQETDFIRDLTETGYDGGFNTTYKPDGWNGLLWHLVGDELSGWVGSTYKDYMLFSVESSKFIPKVENMWHEIVRVVK